MIIISLLEGVENLKKKIILFLIISLILVYPVIGFSSNTTENDDPLITLSYLDYRFEEFNTVVDENISNQGILITNLEEKVNNREKTISELEETINRLKVSSSTLEVVELSENQKIILEAGSEIILRAGTAYAITSEQGGLSDVTAGIDIKEDESIPRNHQLIIPRSDGRGIYVDSYAIFMVTGVYEIIDY